MQSTETGATQSLIVARMDPGHADTVAKIFAASDSGPLPGMLGVTRRSLFAFHGLYFHLIESQPGLEERLDAARGAPEFREVNERLAAYIQAYDEATWRGPRDALAQRFYQWSAG
jgi:cyclase